MMGIKCWKYLLPKIGISKISNNQIKTNLELLGDLFIEFLGDLPERPDLGFECPGIGFEGVRSGWAPWLCSQQYSKGYDFEDSAPSTPLKISWFRS